MCQKSGLDRVQVWVWVQGWVWVQVELGSGLGLIIKKLGFHPGFSNQNSC